MSIDSALRLARALGGPGPEPMEPEPMAMGTQPINTIRHIRSAPMIHEGPIHSNVAGRTDHLPMHVKSGSYVIPADIISSMGEGNTMAGFKIARRMFHSQPYFQNQQTPYSDAETPYGGGDSPYGARMGHADGGKTGLVPIVAAGGEYVIHPRDVKRIGKGDIEHGHNILDEFVKQYRAKTVKTLQKLPGPKRD